LKTFFDSLPTFKGKNMGIWQKQIIAGIFFCSFCFFENNSKLCPYKLCKMYAKKRHVLHNLQEVLLQIRLTTRVECSCKLGCPALQARIFLV